MTILWPNGLTTPPNFSVEGHFGPRNSSAPGASSYHRGLDMWGIGTVRSIADGTVVFVGWHNAAGWSSIAGFMVWIQHDGFFSRYLHLQGNSNRVNVGDRVKAGDPLATEGWTNLTSSAATHLHLEIVPGAWNYSNTGQVDPKAWLYEHVNGANVAGNESATAGDSSGGEMDNFKFYRHSDGRIMTIGAGHSLDLNENDCKKLIDIQRLHHKLDPEHYSPAPTWGKNSTFFTLDQAGWNLIRAIYPPRG